MILLLLLTLKVFEGVLLSSILSLGTHLINSSIFLTCQTFVRLRQNFTGDYFSSSRRAEIWKVYGHMSPFHIKCGPSSKGLLLFMNRSHQRREIETFEVVDKEI